MPIILKLAFRNIWRNPKRSLITIGAISIGVWSAVTLSSIARGLSYGMADDAINNLVGHVQIHAPKYLDDPAAEFNFNISSSIVRDRLSSLKVRAVAERVRVPAVLLSERESVGVNLVGIDPQTEKSLSFIGDGVSEGLELMDQKDPGIIIGKRLKEILKTKLGNRVVLVTQDSNNSIVDRGFRIVGVFDAKLESTEKAFVFVGREVAQSFLNLEDGISEISLKLEDAEMVDAAIATLKMEFPEMEIDSWYVLEPLVIALRKVQDGFLIIWFFIVIVSVSFGVVNTQLMSTFERMREFGVMMALGLKPKRLLSMVTVESLMLLVIGLSMGNLMGAMNFFILSDGIDLSTFAAASEQLGFGKIVIPRFIARDWIQCSVLLVVIGLISTLYPAWKGSRYDPVTSISGRGV